MRGTTLFVSTNGSAPKTVWLNARVDPPAYEAYKNLLTAEGRTISDDLRAYLTRRVKRAQKATA